jgi:Sigma-70 region 2
MTAHDSAAYKPEARAKGRVPSLALQACMLRGDLAETVNAFVPWPAIIDRGVNATRPRQRMATRQLNGFLRRVRTAMLVHEAEGASDAQLLDAFVGKKDEAAFATLVRRHGAMVWGVCRRVVGHVQDAEDAFQATFLVLARKASTILPRALVGNWLYGVAYRTALKARATSKRRRAVERQVAVLPEAHAAHAAAKEA